MSFDFNRVTKTDVGAIPSDSIVAINTIYDLRDYLGNLYAETEIGIFKSTNIDLKTGWFYKIQEKLEEDAGEGIGIEVDRIADQENEDVQEALVNTTVDIVFQVLTIIESDNIYIVRVLEE